MDEVEFLCDAYGTGKPGRIGIMDSGKLIELGTLQQFKRRHGEGLVMKQAGERFEYQFFPTLSEANTYLENLPDKTGIMVRPSNLEDIFVELTGHQLD
jgi:ABC-2 type transport system ATP-binding protein